MKKEIEIKPALEEYRNAFHENFNQLLDNLIENRPFKKIIVKIDVDPYYSEPFLIDTSDGVSKVTINFLNKPNEETFLREVKYVLKQIE